MPNAGLDGTIVVRSDSQRLLMDFWPQSGGASRAENRHGSGRPNNHDLKEGKVVVSDRLCRRRTLFVPAPPSLRGLGGFRGKLAALHHDAPHQPQPGNCIFVLRGPCYRKFVSGSRSLGPVEASHQAPPSTLPIFGYSSFQLRLNPQYQEAAAPRRTLERGLAGRCGVASDCDKPCPSPFFPPHASVDS